MKRYLLLLLLLGSTVSADTLPMQPHTVPEEYKVSQQYNYDEEMLKVSLSETEFHMILDALKIASETLQEQDSFYSNKLKKLRQELLPHFEE